MHNKSVKHNTSTAKYKQLNVHKFITDMQIYAKQNHNRNEEF